MTNTNTNATTTFIEQTTYESVRDYIYEDPEWLYELVRQDLDFLVDGIGECDEPDPEDEEYVIEQLIEILVNEISWDWDWEVGDPNTDEDKEHLRNILKKIFDTGYTIDYLSKEILYEPKREGIYRFRFNSDEAYTFFYLKREWAGDIRYWEDSLRRDGMLLRVAGFDYSLYLDFNECENTIKEGMFYKILWSSEYLDVPNMDKGLFIDWLNNGQPTCMDCGLPVVAWYRDGDSDRYRCESCQWKAFSDDEWDKLCEEDEDEFYYTDLY